MMGSLDLRSIMTLAERLRDGVKCHGYVIPSSRETPFKDYN